MGIKAVQIKMKKCIHYIPMDQNFKKLLKYLIKL